MCTQMIELRFNVYMIYNTYSIRLKCKRSRKINAILSNLNVHVSLFSSSSWKYSFKLGNQLLHWPRKFYAYLILLTNVQVYFRCFKLFENKSVILNKKNILWFFLTKRQHWLKYQQCIVLIDWISRITDTWLSEYSKTFFH